VLGDVEQEALLRSSEKWPKNNRLKLAAAAPGARRSGRYFGSTAITASISAAKMKPAEGDHRRAQVRVGHLAEDHGQDDRGHRDQDVGLGVGHHRQLHVVLLHRAQQHVAGVALGQRRVGARDRFVDPSCVVPIRPRSLCAFIISPSPPERRGTGRETAVNALARCASGSRPRGLRFTAFGGTRSSPRPDNQPSNKARTATERPE
jgi:hypothetical protein